MRKSGNIDFYWDKQLVDYQEQHLENYDKEVQQEKFKIFEEAYQAAFDENLKADDNDQKQKEREELIQEVGQYLSLMKFTDIKVDFDNIFLKCEDFKATFTIPMSKESNIGMKTAKFNSHFCANEWSKIHQNRVKEHVQMIRDFVLFDTLFIFCHVNVVSIYDTIKQDWFHVPFFHDDDIKPALIGGIF